MKNGALAVAKTLTRNAAKIVKLAAKVEALETRKAGFVEMIAALASGKTVTARKTRKVASKTTKTVKTPKTGSKTGKVGRPKGTMSGTSLGGVLLRVSPASTEDAVNKDVLVTKVEKAGYSGKNVKGALGQALSKGDYFEAVKRGFWRRSKAGDAQVAILDAKTA